MFIGVLYDSSGSVSMPVLSSFPHDLAWLILSLWLFILLTPLLIWPDRPTIACHMPRQFCERYPNTRVMADSSFTICDLLLERDAGLNIPPFTRYCARGEGCKLIPCEIHATKKNAVWRNRRFSSKSFGQCATHRGGYKRPNLQGPLIKQWCAQGLHVHVITWAFMPRTYCHV